MVESRLGHAMDQGFETREGSNTGGGRTSRYGEIEVGETTDTRISHISVYW